jgi:hypothetical protein
VCGGNMLGATGSLGAAGPVIHHLSPWMPLITTPDAIVGWPLGYFSPGALVDRCGRPTSVPRDAPPMLRDT